MVLSKCPCDGIGFHAIQCPLTIPRPNQQTYAKHGRKEQLANALYDPYGMCTTYIGTPTTSINFCNTNSINEWYEKPSRCVTFVEGEVCLQPMV
jgi:hypothetical protein